MSKNSKDSLLIKIPLTLACGEEEEGDEGGENQLKQGGIGSTWRQLPTIKHKITIPNQTL